MVGIDDSKVGVSSLAKTFFIYKELKHLKNIFRASKSLKNTYRLVV